MKKLALLMSAALMCCATSSMAETLSYASGWPPGASVTPVFEKFAKAVKEKSNGDLEVKVYPLSLLNFKEANEGVRDGVADMATVLPPYFASEYPNLNLIGEISAVMAVKGNETDLPSPAFAGAMTELVMLGCPECLEEIKSQNQLLVGSAVTPPYLVSCTAPINSAADLKGKRMRTAGAFWARWTEAMGGVPVSLSINETFEALEQGVLDCVVGNPPDLVNFSLVDVVKHIYVGAPSGMFPFPSTINRDRWVALSEDKKRAMFAASAELISGLTWDYHSVGLAAIEEAKSRKIDVTTTPADIVANTQAFLAEDFKALSQSYKERFKLENADALISKMQELVPRWIKLVEGVKSEEELSAVFYSEIYSKIDATTYGN